MKRRNAILSALALVLLAASQAAYADRLQNIIDSGKLTVAVVQDYPPYGSVGADLQPIGYDIDTAGLIARKLGVKLVLVSVTSTNRIPYIISGKVDMVIANLGKTAEREKVISFSHAYAPYYNGVFGPPQDKVERMADLAGKTIGVTRGSIEDLELTQGAPASTTIKRFEDSNSTMSAFLSGQVDLVATGNAVAATVLSKNPPRRPETKFLIKSSPCAIGINKDEKPLLAKVNDIIDQAKADGELSAISKKWLRIDLPKDL
ncbi:amino acid ABC transporter substrate-binding protein [Bordetella genomosp. 10]|uniref:Amino acid ABC transporter substrate-binding protein n=1 Tax=Bordetella genomosp. 10 TaxID=1416804 RepID=A0A261SD15_9BORD|nr:transporter substrate-binding domain-containing protein [Bordetella genomosp. 10]OZI34263.1 amino acid ABC transporter substrate-binding protein [Bordetella genomosp. 10]